jgi:O-antigen ligase/polysaccharide polymerase Wzy-like membrane protein
VTTLRIRRGGRLVPAVVSWARDPRVPDWVRLAAAVAVLMPAVALLLVVGAAGHPGAYRALGGVLALAALAVAIMRPAIAPVAIGAIVMANAGQVIHDRADVPDILHAALALSAIALLARPSGRAQLVARTPVMVAALAFATVRWLSALLASGTADSGAVLRDLAWGLVLVAVVTAAVSDRRALRWTVRTVVVVGAALAVLTILKRLGLDGTFEGFAKHPAVAPEVLAELRGAAAPVSDRATGPLGDPTLWAQALLLVLPLAGWLAWEARGRARLAWIGAGALMVVSIAITQSRSAFVGLGLMVALALWARGRRRLRLGLAVLAALTIGGAAFYVTSHYETVNEIRTAPASEHAALRARISENLAGLYMLEDHPLNGVGAGEFEDNYQAYARRIGIDDRFKRSAHNSYVQIAAESGVLGLITFVGLLVATLGSAMRARRLLLAARRVVDARLAEAMVIGVGVYAAMAAVNDFAFPIYLWLAMGLAGGLLIIAEAEARRVGVLPTAAVATAGPAAAAPAPAPSPGVPRTEGERRRRFAVPGVLRRRRGGNNTPRDDAGPAPD